MFFSEIIPAIPVVVAKDVDDFVLLAVAASVAQPCEAIVKRFKEKVVTKGAAADPDRPLVVRVGKFNAQQQIVLR